MLIFGACTLSGVVAEICGSTSEADLDSKDWQERQVKMERYNLEVKQGMRELDSWEKMDSKERKDWKTTRDCQEPQDSMIKRV